MDCDNLPPGDQRPGKSGTQQVIEKRLMKGNSVL